MTISPSFLNAFALLLGALVGRGASPFGTVRAQRNQDRLQRVARLHNAHRELTIEEVVADPIVCDLMRADHVDPDAFETLLRSVAARSMAANPFMGRPPTSSGLAMSSGCGPSIDLDQGDERGECAMSCATSMKRSPPNARTPSAIAPSPAAESNSVQSDADHIWEVRGQITTGE